MTAHREHKAIRILLLLLAAAIAAAQPSAHASKNEHDGRIPEFAYPYPDQQGKWINSAPLSVRDLRGKVFMVEFWTFGCVNCRRSVPWVKEIEAKFPPGEFAVIGVHTPEFAHEKDPAAVREAVGRLGITHPVMLDNDFVYWKDMNNRYWPAYYLVDRRGRVAGSFIGEVRQGTEKAARIERAIRALL